jgi:hypothetical protein
MDTNTSISKDGILVNNFLGRRFVRFFFRHSWLMDLAINEHEPTKPLGIIDYQEEIRTLQTEMVPRAVNYTESDDIYYGILQAKTFINMLLEIRRSKPQSNEVVLPLLQALSMLPDTVYEGIFSVDTSISTATANATEILVESTTERSDEGLHEIGSPIKNQSLEILHYLVWLLGDQSYTCADASASILLKIIDHDQYDTAGQIFQIILDYFIYRDYLYGKFWDVLHRILVSSKHARLIDKFEKNVVSRFASSMKLSNDTLEVADTAWRASISLEDTVKVLVNNTWVEGVVVRMNAISNEVIVEYEDPLHQSALMITIDRNSELLGQVNNNSKSGKPVNSVAEFDNMKGPFPRSYPQLIRDLYRQDMAAMIQFPHLFSSKKKSSSEDSQFCRHSFRHQIYERDESMHHCDSCKLNFEANCSRWICATCQLSVCELCLAMHYHTAESSLSLSDDEATIVSGCLDVFSSVTKEMVQSMISNIQLYRFHVEDSIIRDADGDYEFSYWAWSKDNHEKYPVFEKMVQSSNSTENIIIYRKKIDEVSCRWSIGRETISRGVRTVTELYYSIGPGQGATGENLSFSTWKLTDEDNLKIVNTIKVAAKIYPSYLLSFCIILRIIDRMRQLEISLSRSEAMLAEYEHLRQDLIVSSGFFITYDQNASSNTRDLMIDESALLQTMEMARKPYKADLQRAHQLPSLIENASSEVRSIALEFILYEVNYALTSYAIALSNNPNLAVPSIVQHSWLFLMRATTATGYATVFTVFFLHPMLLKFSVLIQEYVKSQLSAMLSSDDEVEEREDIAESMLAVFSHISSTLDAFSLVMRYASQSHRTFQDYVDNELSYLAKINGYSYFSDEIMNSYRRFTGISSKDKDKKNENLILERPDYVSRIITALQRCLADDYDRLSQESQNLRQLLHCFREHISPDNIPILELMWRDALADWIFSRLRSSLKSVQEDAIPSKAKTFDFVETIVEMLKTALEVSNLDIAVNEDALSSVEKAFTSSYRRLSMNEAYELTKILAIYISILMDSTKQDCFSRGWQDAMDSTTKLIRILYDNLSIEFQHFYELLLARRLLKNRYFSITTESQTLHELPAMNSAHSMLLNIHATSFAMDDFRNYLLYRVDIDQTKYSDEFLHFTFKSDSLQIHCLSSSLWPSSLISPLPYAGLAMPKLMQTIMHEYLNFSGNFADKKQRNIFASLMPNENLHSITSIPVMISCKQLGLDGDIFDPSFTSESTYPVYTRRHPSNPSFLHEEMLITYDPSNKAWNLRRVTDHSSRKYLQPSELIASCVINKYVPLQLAGMHTWKIALSSLDASESGSESARMLISAYCSNSMRKRLTWCHEGGLILLKCYLPYDVISYLRVTEPQAALLLRFGVMSPDERAIIKSSYNLLELCDLMNLSPAEVREIISTLSTRSCPIIQYEEDLYSLSPIFLSGSLGGYKDDDPINLSSYHERNCSDGQLASEGLNILNGWRNEIIDAAMVKYLKELSISKKGDITNSKGIYGAAVSIDRFCEDIRRILADRFILSDEDFMRRSDHLASVGIIEKCHGSSTGLRSVGYSYLSETEMKKLHGRESPLRPAPVNLTRENKSDEKSREELRVKGVDLFHHLCMVLLIPNQSSAIITKQYFVRKFMEWMSRSTFNIFVSDSSSTSASSHLCLHLLRQVREADIQLCCLREQFLEDKAPNSISAADASSTSFQYSDNLFRGVSALESTFSTISHSYSPYGVKPKLRFPEQTDTRSTNNPRIQDTKNDFRKRVYKVFLEHMPIELLREFMSHLRTIARYGDTMIDDEDDTAIVERLSSKEVIKCSVYRPPFTSVDEFGDMHEFFITERKELRDELDDLLGAKSIYKLDYSELCEILQKDVVDILFAEMMSNQFASRSPSRSNTSPSTGAGYEFEDINPIRRSPPTNLRRNNAFSRGDTTPTNPTASSSSRWASNSLSLSERLERARLSETRPFDSASTRNASSPRALSSSSSVFPASAGHLTYPEVGMYGSGNHAHSASPHREVDLSSYQNMPSLALDHYYMYPPRPPPSIPISPRGRAANAVAQPTSPQSGRRAAMMYGGYMDDDDDDDDDDVSDDERQEEEHDDDDDSEGLINPSDYEDRSLFTRSPSRAPFNWPMLPSMNDEPVPSFPPIYPSSPSRRAYSSQSRSLMITVTMETIIDAYFTVAEPKLVDLIHDDEASYPNFITFIHRYCFDALYPSLANLLKVPYPYEDELKPRFSTPASTPSRHNRTTTNSMAHDPDGEGTGDDPAETSVEAIYLPCEFCTETIPIQYFQLHQDACQRGIRVNLPPIGFAFHTARSNSSTESGNNEKASGLRVRPSLSSELVLSIIKNLYDVTTSTAVSALTTSGSVSSPSSSSLVIDKMHADDTLSQLLEASFDLMDIQRKGHISRHEFVGTADDIEQFHTPVGSDAPPIDPVLLYGKLMQSSAIDRSADPQQLQPAAILSTSKAKSLDPDHHPSSPKLSMVRVDSMWRSIAQDKSLPSLEPHRSVFGIFGAKDEFQSLVNRTKEIINESSAITIALLIHYLWDSKTLIEDYIDSPIYTRSKAHLGPKDKPSFLRHDLHNEEAEADDKAKDAVLCGICFSEQPRNETFALCCGHWYCQECWQGYLTSSIGNRDVKIKCPQPKCNYIVSSDMFDCLCDDETIELAREYLAQAYVEGRQGRRGQATYCKNPRGCNGIVLMSDDADTSDAHCSFCGYSFCSLCDLSHHAPANCEQVVKWEENEGYLETGNEEEILARQCKLKTTKPCPKCSVRIEKNGGCPHISCKFCKHQFCWECGGEFHTTTSCSRPKVSSDTNPVFEFEELNRECINHFSARKLAMEYLKANQMSRRRVDELFMDQTNDCIFRQLKIDGWKLLADAHAALAYTCIVRYDVKTDRIKILYHAQRLLTQAIQNKMLDLENKAMMRPGSNRRCSAAYLNVNYPDAEYKAAIRLLRRRLREYILAIRVEIFSENSNGSAAASRATSETNNFTASASTATGAAATASGLAHSTPSRRHSSGLDSSTGYVSSLPPMLTMSQSRGNRPAAVSSGETLADWRNRSVFGYAFDLS